MAAALIPLIPSLIPVAVEVVKAIETVFGAGSGPKKKDTATTIIQEIDNLLSGHSTLSPQQISDMVEQAVTVMKTVAGQLQPSPAPAAITVTGADTATSTVTYDPKSYYFQLSGTVRCP